MSVRGACIPGLFPDLVFKIVDAIWGQYMPTVWTINQQKYDAGLPDG
jgi:hypothetical protein